MVEFGKKIRTLRTEHKFTQKQLADLLGVAVSAISAYESGNRYPSYDVLIRLSRVFHVSIDYLFGLEKNETIDVTGLNDDEINVVVQMINVLRERK